MTNEEQVKGWMETIRRLNDPVIPIVNSKNNLIALVPRQDSSHKWPVIFPHE